MKTTSGSNRKVQLGFGSAILALLIVGAASYRGLAVSTASTRWVRHTHDVLEILQDLQFALESIESSSRGFVLTGNENFLETYNRSRSRAAQDQAGLRSLTASNAQIQRQLPALELLAAQQVQEAERVIAMRRAQGMEAAAEPCAAEAANPGTMNYTPPCSSCRWKCGACWSSAVRTPSCAWARCRAS